MKETFVSLVTKCGTKSAPLILILDGIDRIKQDFDWLPKEIPKFMKLIVSFSGMLKMESTSKRTIVAGMKREQIVDVDLFENFIRKFLPDQEEQETNLLKLNEGNIEEILQQMITKYGIVLNCQQNDFIVEKCKLCPLPLVIEISALMTSQWTYMTSQQECEEIFSSAKDTLESFVICYLKLLEARHGKSLITAVCCLITTSKHGMCSEEMETILSYDVTIGNWLMEVLRWPKQRIEGNLLT